MGVEPFLLANVINIILAQRLVRKLCEGCKLPLSKDKYQLALSFGLTQEDLAGGNIFEASNGCKKCNHGYKGRISIVEALYFSPEIRKVILDASSEINEGLVREIAESQGMLSLKDSGIHRIREGISTIEEIIYSTSEE
jgi:type IV pilus assembly protein PilB